MEKLLVVRHARKQAPDWDMFTLNWYCNSGHWKECDKNKGSLPIATPEWFIRRQLYSYTSNLGQAAVVPVKYFMSGGSYAVSSRGAKKPIDVSVRLGEIRAPWRSTGTTASSLTTTVGVLGESTLVLMPEMGSVQPGHRCTTKAHHADVANINGHTL